MSYRPEELRIPGETPTHQTAGGILVVHGEVLLEQRSPDALIYPDCWDLPGGHLESGESPEEALAREFDEELGIEIEAIALCAVQDDRERTTGRLYRHYTFAVHSHRGAVVAREGQPLQWWPLNDAVRSSSLNPLVAWVLRLALEEGWISS